MPESKTVLFLSNHFITLYNFRRELIARLVERGHRVVLSMPPDEQNTYFRELGCEIVETPMSRRGMNPAEDLRLLSKYKKIMREVRPDIVLSYTAKPNIYGSLASHALGIRQVCNITGMGTTLVRENAVAKIVRALYRISVSRAYKVFFQNRDDRDYFIRHGLVKDNWAVIPGSGVNLEEHPLSPMPDDGATRFLYIGRIVRLKGIDQFLECAKAVRARHPDTRFYLAGFLEQEFYQPILEEYEKIGAVEYLGFRRDVVDWIRRCHCTILPSHGGEGVPNAVLESAAMGRPCIVSNVPGSRDAVVDGVTGFFFEPGDSEGLAACVERFLALPKEARAQMGLAGHEKVAREFDREVVIRTYLREVEG